MHNVILAIMGPTGAGKTEVAINLVQKLPCEIISVDSSMVYRGMDIGTAKPTLGEQKQAPHRLIDICDAKEIYSVARFCQDAKREIEDIIQHGKIPLLVGGTMLYFRALLYGLTDLPARDENIRKQLEEDRKKYGVENLHAKLNKIDPIMASKIEATDWQRIQRALEIYLLTKKPPSDLYQENKVKSLIMPIITIGLIPADRAFLHEKLAKRFYEMLRLGFIEEVEKFYQRGDLSLKFPAMRAVGYRQIWQYLSGELNYQQMIDNALAATRQLAKRQLTWLRSWPNLYRLNCGDANLMDKLLLFLDKYYAS